MFRYSDQVMPEPDANPGMIGNGQDEDTDINKLAADVSDGGYGNPAGVEQSGGAINPSQMGENFSGPMADEGETMGNPTQVQQQLAEQNSPSVASKDLKEAYRRVIATDSDLYNQGLQDRLNGKPQDEALANLSDDYRWGYEQGGFYNGSTGDESAPAFEHIEMGKDSDKITRNPVARKRHEFSDRLADQDYPYVAESHGGERHVICSEEEEPHPEDVKARHTASDPMTLDNDNAVIEGDDVLDEDKNNSELEPAPYDEEADDYTLEKDPEDRGMNAHNPTTTGDSGSYNEGLTTVGSIIASSHEVLADTTWFRDSSESLYDRLDTLQRTAGLLSRVASSNQIDEGEYSRVASLLAEANDQFESVKEVTASWIDFDTEDYLQSLPGGVVASNYGSLDRDGDIGPDDGSFLYREASRVRDEVRALDIEEYTKTSAKMYVADQEERLLKNADAFREASLYFVFEDTLPILDSVRRASVIDEFMTEAERIRRVAVRQLNSKDNALAKTAATHKAAWHEDLDEIFGRNLWT